LVFDQIQTGADIFLLFRIIGRTGVRPTQGVCCVGRRGLFGQHLVETGVALEKLSKTCQQAEDVLIDLEYGQALGPGLRPPQRGAIFDQT